MTQPPSQVPPPLPYEPNVPAPRRSWRHFFAGLIAGSIVSAVLWFYAFHTEGNSEAILGWMIMIPLVKFIVTVVLLVLPSLRRFGLGVLASFLIGGMIFFGLCAIQM